MLLAACKSLGKLAPKRRCGRPGPTGPPGASVGGGGGRLSQRRTYGPAWEAKCWLVNTNMYNALCMLSGIDITWLAPVGNVVSISVEDQVDLACECVVTTLRLRHGSEPVVDAVCNARIAPLVAAMDATRINFRGQFGRSRMLLQNRGQRLHPCRQKGSGCGGKSWRRGHFVSRHWPTRPSHSTMFPRRRCRPLRRSMTSSKPAVLGGAGS